IFLSWSLTVSIFPSFLWRRGGCSGVGGHGACQRCWGQERANFSRVDRGPSRQKIGSSPRSSHNAVNAVDSHPSTSFTERPRFCHIFEEFRLRQGGTVSA